MRGFIAPCPTFAGQNRGAWTALADKTTSQLSGSNDCAATKCVTRLVGDAFVISLKPDRQEIRKFYCATTVSMTESESSELPRSCDSIDSAFRKKTLVAVGICDNSPDATVVSRVPTAVNGALRSCDH